jgi:copper resistance protein C
VPFRPGPAGRYTVAYEVASADGHPIKGSVRFTLTTGVAPPTPTAAATSAAPATPASSPTGTGSAAALDPTSGAEDAGGPWGWVLGALALIVLLGAGAFLVRRRARA